MSHLPERKIEELETVTRRIVDTGKAEIVVLFGSYARGDYKERRGAVQGKKSDYDILVVTAGVDEDTLLRNLEGQFDDISVHVQLIAEDIETVNANIEEGQFFFSDIKREGKILYTSGRHGLAKPQEISPVRRRELAEEDFENWFNKAANFFILQQMAEQNQLTGEAAFLLQQTVEMCYTTVEMVFAHYNPHGHDLGILRRRAAGFDRRIDDAFPRETGEQSALFMHLNYAYIGGRYRTKEEFPVTAEQLDYWAAETKKLLDITEIACRERIEELKKIVEFGN